MQQRRRGPSGRGSARMGDSAGPDAAAGADGAGLTADHAGRSARGGGTGRSSRAGETAGLSTVQVAELARSIVLRQLTSSPKSRLQLAAKLAERGIPEDIATQVLDRFEEVDLVDDAEFARMWVRSRADSRSLARSVLRRELADKGIVGEQAEEALSQRSDEDEVAAATDLVQRRLRPGTDLSDHAERDRQARRLVAMLGRRGYSSSLAFRVVKNVLDSGHTP